VRIKSANIQAPSLPGLMRKVWSSIRKHNAGWLLFEFRQGGASRFFPMPMIEMSNQIVQLQAVWRKGGHLRERLLDARTPESKFRALEELLLGLS